MAHFMQHQEKILGEAGDERKSNRWVHGQYTLTQKPVTCEGTLPARCGFVADAYNQIVLSVDTDNGRAKF